MLDGQARHVNRYSPIKRILCTNFSKSTGLTMYELQRCLYMASISRSSEEVVRITTGK